ncbi:hypothetical protein C2G38_2202299 [Gigaspora rosea]|uniref:Uncharacterized protein n=1 Tax=Gigaspora rosea TaxID=44941 RepID=A0A397UWE6_9GLOM|nr:hypothetical protein C2G38_2202299 [Gigaspora rosea]
MEKWRKSSRYVVEIHKQEDNWEDIISTIEGFLSSNPSASESVFTSFSADKHTEQDVRCGQKTLNNMKKRIEECNK